MGRNDKDKRYEGDDKHGSVNWARKNHFLVAKDDGKKLFRMSSHNVFEALFHRCRGDQRIRIIS